MKKHTFEEVEACFAECPKFAWSQVLSGDRIVPASEKSIQEAEALLGLKFPKDYRTFLAKWGVLEFTYTYSTEIYGILLDNAQAYGDPSVVFLTLKGREFAELPHQYIAIYSNEGDEYWCIDTDDPNESVIAWDFFERCVARKIADSFMDVLYQFAANERRVKWDENGNLLDEENTQYEEVHEINHC